MREQIDNPPSSVRSAVESLVRKTRSPAFLLLDRERRVADSWGALERYGLAGLRAGDTAAESVDLLQGMQPVPDDGILLSPIEVHSGVFADVHLFRSGALDAALFLDATPEVSRRAQMEQALR